MKIEFVLPTSKGESKLRRRVLVIHGEEKTITISFIKRWFHAWALAGQLRVSLLGIEYHSAPRIEAPHGDQLTAWGVIWGLERESDAVFRKRILERMRNGRPTGASGESLDSLAKTPATSRTYYGDNKDVKPNDHCYWDGGLYSQVKGWHENDAHLRERVKVNLK